MLHFDNERRLATRTLTTIGSEAADRLYLSCARYTARAPGGPLTRRERELCQVLVHLCLGLVALLQVPCDGAACAYNAREHEDEAGGDQCNQEVRILEDDGADGLKLRGATLCRDFESLRKSRGREVMIVSWSSW